MSKPEGLEIGICPDPLTLVEGGGLCFEAEAGVDGDWYEDRSISMAELSNELLSGYHDRERRLAVAKHLARVLEAEAARVLVYALDDDNFHDDLSQL